MKKLHLIFVISLLINIEVTPQWYEYNNIPGNSATYFSSVHFQDGDNGWITSNNGKIFRTTDAGSSWLQQYTGVYVPLRRIRFADLNNGWAVGDSGIILHTSNAGDEWEIQYRNTGWLLRWFSLVDSANAWVLGTFGAYGAHLLLHTSNSGAAWDSVNLPTLISGQHLTNLLVLNSSKIWITSYYWTPGYPSGGKLYYSNDNGQSWFNPLHSSEGHNSIFFIDETNGWSVGYGNESVYKTQNGGTSWVGVNSIDKIFTDVRFINQNQGWLVDYVVQGDGPRHSYLNYTFDGGTTISSQFYSPDRLITDFYIDKLGIGWAVGQRGLILKTTNGGGVFTDNDETSSVSLTEYSLDQNFPNPFNPSTKISWQSPVSGWQTLKVYDLLGNEIAILVNEEKPAGNYEVEFDASHLSSGVYYYQLRTGEFVNTKKMILMK